MAQRDHSRSIAGTSFLLPIVNGAMHLPPAISATHVTLGRNQPVDKPILTLLFALHVLIDVLDKYADLPSNVRKTWSTRIALFASPFVLLVAYGTWHCGALALFRLLGVPLLAVVHGTPLIPVYSFKTGELSMVKLKAILGPFKSIFGATCIALMDVTAVVAYLRGTIPHSRSASRPGAMGVLMYTIMYDFLWESIADVRDFDEDQREGVTTLATAFGVQSTLLLVGVTTIVGDLLVTTFGGGSAVLSVLRSVAFCGAFSALALYKPRRATYAWSVGSLVGLLPVWLATLGESYQAR